MEILTNFGIQYRKQGMVKNATKFVVNNTLTQIILWQSENHAANKVKTAGRYQFDTHLTYRIGLSNKQPVFQT